jgi:hypothetical protein
MACGVMATLTKQRHPVGQQLAVITPVNGMAGFAILFHGRMLPEKRSALFRMAFVTQLIDRPAFDELRPKASMVIVAICAFDFTLPDGMMRLFGNLSAKTLVTRQTQFRLSRL